MPAVTGATIGQRWSTAAVKGGQRRSTAAYHHRPPSDHRSTTAGPPVNHRLTAVDRQSTVGSNGGHRCHVAAKWYHVATEVAADVAWRGYYPPAMFQTHDQR
ncbi:hypothetical protein Tco_1239493, partial [Tanacetum coccineum]